MSHLEQENERLRDLNAELLAALEAQEAWSLMKPTPWGHDCQWCGECGARVVLMRVAALKRTRAIEQK